MTMIKLKMFKRVKILKVLKILKSLDEELKTNHLVIIKSILDTQYMWLFTVAD